MKFEKDSEYCICKYCGEDAVFIGKSVKFFCCAACFAKAIDAVMEKLVDNAD